MEIKILVPENRESDLDNFIKDCENKGFELQNRGGGHMPSFSGYYATLKGKSWKSENNRWIKIESTDQRYPEEDVWVCSSHATETVFFHQAFAYISRDFTHYQPIQKPEPPKF